MISPTQILPKGRRSETWYQQDVVHVVTLLITTLGSCIYDMFVCIAEALDKTYGMRYCCFSSATQMQADQNMMLQLSDC